DAQGVAHGAAAVHAVIQRLSRHDVALDALDRAHAAQVALRAATDQAAHGGSLGAQGLDDRPPHESRAARDEDPSHRRRLHDLRISIRSGPDDKIGSVVVSLRPAVGLALSLALALTSVPAWAQDWSGIDEAAVDAVGSGEIPGVVVLIGRGDQVLYRRAWGSRRVVPEHVAMTEDTIFDIASLTKPFGTTLAVMSLVERGHVKLDAPLGRYLREFRGHMHDGVTIRRLLPHSARLPAFPPDATMRPGFRKAAALLAKLPLDSPPGTAFQYSDTGFMLLGEMVRRVSGDSLDHYLEQRVFKPLSLRDTSFNPVARVRDRIAPT